MQIDSREDTLNHLRSNFRRHYNGNRAPLLVSTHGRWVSKPERLQAFREFISEILAKPDVYLVTVQQMLRWMSNPMPALQTRQSWSPCSNTASTPTTVSVKPCTDNKSCTNGSKSNGQRTQSSSLSQAKNQKELLAAKSNISSTNLTAAADSVEFPIKDSKTITSPNNTERDVEPSQIQQPDGSSIIVSPEKLPEIYPDALLIASLQALEQQKSQMSIARFQQDGASVERGQSANNDSRATNTADFHRKLEASSYNNTYDHVVASSHQSDGKLFKEPSKARHVNSAMTLAATLTYVIILSQSIFFL